MSAEPLGIMLFFIIVCGVVIASVFGLVIAVAVLFSRHQRNSIESLHAQVRSPVRSAPPERRTPSPALIAVGLLGAAGLLLLMINGIALTRARQVYTQSEWSKPAPLVDMAYELPPPLTVERESLPEWAPGNSFPANVPLLPAPTLPLPTLPAPSLPVPSWPVPGLPVPTLPAPLLRAPTLSEPAPELLPAPVLPAPLVPVANLSAPNGPLPQSLVNTPADDAPVSAQEAVDRAHTAHSITPPPIVVVPESQMPVDYLPPYGSAPPPVSAVPAMPHAQPQGPPYSSARGIGVTWLGLALLIIAGGVAGVIMVMLGVRTFLPQVFSTAPVTSGTPITTPAAISDHPDSRRTEISPLLRVALAAAVGPAVLVTCGWFINNSLTPSGGWMPAPMMTDRPRTESTPPDWIQPNYRSPHSPARATISGALFATPAEATTGAQAAIRRWANSQLQRIGKDPLPNEVQDWMIGSVSVVDVYRETVEHDFGTFQAPMHRLWVEVEWSSRVARKLEDLRDGGNRSDRLLVLSLLAGLVVTLAASLVTWCDARQISPHSTLLPLASGTVVFGTYVSCILLGFS